MTLTFGRDINKVSVWSHNDQVHHSWSEDQVLQSCKMQRYYKCYITSEDSTKILRTGAAQQQANFTCPSLYIRQKTSVFVNISFFSAFLVYLHLKYSLHSPRKYLRENTKLKCQKQKNHYLYFTNWILDRQLFVNGENKLLKESVSWEVFRQVLSAVAKSPQNSKSKRNVFHLQGHYRKLVENTKLFCQCIINHIVLYLFIFTGCVSTSHPKTANQPPTSYPTVICFTRQHFRGLKFGLKIWNKI